MMRPFRIALIMQGGRGWMGGVEYIRNIIFALGSLPQEDLNTYEISLLANTQTDHAFIESVRPFLKKVYITDELIPPTILNRIRWAAKRHLFRVPDNRYDSIIKENNFDFVYPCTTPYDGYSFKKVAAWIPDFQHKYLPQFFTHDDIISREYTYGLIARTASVVVLSSKSVEKDFKKFYPEVASKSRVLSFKTFAQAQWFDSNPLDFQAKYNLPDKFFIISNQFWQHKDHLTVFKALKLLKDTGINPVVVCTGHIYDYRQPEYSDLILQMIHQSGLARQVYLLGLIPKIDQIQLLRRSIGLLQPSLFEGWSTVIEDARLLGKPIILSDIPVHIEQNPPNSQYFIRSSPESLAPVIANYWDSFFPGPDKVQELMGKEMNKKEVLEFANNFIKIAKSSSII